MAPSLTYDSASFRYGRGRPVFESFSHEFRSGVLTWLKGANGSGKTTLLRLGAGLLRVRTGSIASSERPCYVASNTSFHEQLTLSEELLYLKSVAQVPLGTIETQLSRWGLSELDPEMEMDELSTGWRQRLALSLACAADRGIVLMDEPFANLDADGARVLLEWLVRSASRGGVIVVAQHGERELSGDIDVDVVSL